MKPSKKQVFVDTLILAASILLAIYLIQSGALDIVIRSLGALRWLGILIGGMLFSSAFTTAPAIAFLGEMAQTTSLIPFAILGGLGAMLADCVLFYFVKDRIAADLSYLLGYPKRKRLPHIFRTKLFKFFVPFLGALVIASPLPDEIGITALGLSRVSGLKFLLLSFLANAFGLICIGLIARAVVGN